MFDKSFFLNFIHSLGFLLVIGIPVALLVYLGVCFVELEWANPIQNKSIRVILTVIAAVGIAISFLDALNERTIYGDRY